jgi:acyl-CoA thioesterase I
VSSEWRRILIALLATGLLFAFWYWRERDGTVFWKPISGEYIVALGDSLTEGVGATPGNTYPDELSRLIGEEVLNAGQSGDTTEDALERLDRTVFFKNPRIVIVLLGGNDIIQGTPAEVTFQNLGLIIDRVRSRGIQVVLVGIPGGPFFDLYKRRFDALAKEKAVPYVQNVLRGIFGTPSLMADSIHPNDAGYALIAERIRLVLQKLLNK